MTKELKHRFYYMNAQDQLMLQTTPNTKKSTGENTYKNILINKIYYSLGTKDSFLLYILYLYNII